MAVCTEFPRIKEVRAYVKKATGDQGRRVVSPMFILHYWLISKTTKFA